jgi:hypothetical protein
MHLGNINWLIGLIQNNYFKIGTNYQDSKYLQNNLGKS